ncbi:hypothetical protein CRUP_025194, partial [Coryphaenoides rupestris]
DTFQHHWREGNLPSGARCEVCRRSCSSSDFLAGMRCEWCGITLRRPASEPFGSWDETALEVLHLTPSTGRLGSDSAWPAHRIAQASRAE